MTITPLKPRYHQRHAVDAFFDYTRNNWERHPIIVLPTGSGKSLVQAHIVKTMLEYPNTRILLLTHQQELIKQNYNELIDNFQNDLFLDVGIYSAGLKRRDTKNRIIFAGIQSIYKRAWELGFFDIILVDECHLIPHSGEGMYRTFFKDMMEINPKIVIGGLSATAYRMKEGLLTEGKGALFHDICHETTVTELINPNDFRNLDNQQYLCNVISPDKSMKNKVDLSNVSVRGKEYVSEEMEKAFLENNLVRRAVDEFLQYTTDRKKVLIFTAGIKHCEEVVEEIKRQGFEARCVHSKQSSEINQQNIIDYKTGRYKYLVNVNMLTTGFNDKTIDCVVLLRSTMSPGLYYQMVGRLLRMLKDKINGLVLDFGRNIEKHGPIDKIEVRRKKDGTSEIRTMPQKECPECNQLLALAVMICPTCGYEFPQKDKHDETASEASILSKWKKPETLEIDMIFFYRHKKTGKPDSLRVDYSVGIMETYSEWICIEHAGFAKKKAMNWIERRTDKHIETVQDALDHEDFFRQPTHIIVNFNNKFPEITGYIFEDDEKYKNRIEQKQQEIDDQIPF